MTGRPDAAMIFAAGFGTRMGPLTADTPKPMLEVGGGPMVDIAIDFARQAGIGTIVANTHYLHERIAPHLSKKGVTVSHEHPDILDTGGGLKMALPHLGRDPVVTMNPDAGWRGPNPVTVLMEAWRDDLDALLLVVPRERAIGRQSPGDFELIEGRLRRAGSHVYTGVQIIRPELVERYPEDIFSLNAVWDRLIEKDLLAGHVYPGEWCDIGHPEGLRLANELVSGRV